jgi:chromosome segregation ATPase
MNNIGSLAQVLQNLKAKQQRIESDLAAKKNALKAAEMEKERLVQLERTIEGEVRRDEQSIAKEEKEMGDIKRRDIPKVDETIRHLAEEVRRIQTELDQHNREVSEAQRSSR